METKRILIVEDEVILAVALEVYLRSKGYAICGFLRKGRDAIDKAIKLKPDILIMDVLLADDIDGISAVEEIHKEVYIPVIFMTATNDDKTLQRIKNVQAIDILPKPFSNEKLLGLIEKTPAPSSVHK
jgi:CheY-like chemotaxis protein